MTVLSPGRVARILADAARYRGIVVASELAALAESHEKLRERLRELEGPVDDVHEIPRVEHELVGGARCSKGDSARGVDHRTVVEHTATPKRKARKAVVVEEIAEAVGAHRAEPSARGTSC